MSFLIEIMKTLALMTLYDCDRGCVRQVTDIPKNDTSHIRLMEMGKMDIQ